MYNQKAIASEFCVCVCVCGREEKWKIEQMQSVFVVQSRIEKIEELILTDSPKMIEITNFSFIILG